MANASIEKPYYIDDDIVDEDGIGAFERLCKRYYEKCLQVSWGRNRNVFDMGTYVVKVPKNFDGLIDNDWEGSVSNSEDGLDQVQFARTRIAYRGDVPVVFMEYVEPASTSEIVARLGHEPDWVMSVDCGQVGFNLKGELVAYDYGIL